MAQVVTRTCTMIIYDVKVYDESTDKVFSVELALEEGEKPNKAIPELLTDAQSMIKAKPIKKVEELRKMTSRFYYNNSELVSSKTVEL